MTAKAPTDDLQGHDDGGASLPIFRLAAETIRQAIRSGALAQGVVVQETALCERLGLSCSPTRRALALLEEEGVMSRHSGRGYIVGPAIQNPLKVDLASIAMDLDDLEGDGGTPNWMRIQNEAEADLSRCLVFGHFRVIEQLMADHFDVSRTVVRDVLSRLQERGLVAKSATSRWIVQPLTAKAVADKFELRMILEMAALRSAAGHLDAATLKELQAALSTSESKGEVSADDWFDLVNRFIDLTILSTPNSDLAAMVNANRKMLQASQKALFSLGLPADLDTLRELRLIVELLLGSSAEAAAQMLESHIRKSLARTIAQLKIVAVLKAPDGLPSYVQAA